MRILVTGGAGFIGSNIVEELVKRRYKVRILDNFSEGKKENIEKFLNKIELIKDDIRDIKSCKSAVKDVDYVLHQAAMRSVPKSVEKPLLYNEVNITGTLNMLLASREEGVKRFIFASSSSVYGEGKKFPQREDYLPHPVSPYAVTKLVGEYYCKIFSKLYNLETVSLRYFNVFGPKQDPLSEYAAVIPKFILWALNDEELEIHGDGLQSRDFSYIDNVVSANILSCYAKGVSGMVFNVACGKTYSILNVAELISKILNKKLKYKFTEPRAGDVRKTYADISLSKKFLNNKPKIDLEEGLKRTIKYFQKIKCEF